MPREHNVMREMVLDLRYHPPNGVESSCERSMIPGGLCTARGEKKTHTHKHSVLKDQTINIQTSAFGTVVPYCLCVFHLAILANSLFSLLKAILTDIKFIATLLNE